MSHIIIMCVIQGCYPVGTGEMRGGRRRSSTHSSPLFYLLLQSSGIISRTSGHPEIQHCFQKEQKHARTAASLPGELGRSSWLTWPKLAYRSAVLVIISTLVFEGVCNHPFIHPLMIDYYNPLHSIPLHSAGGSGKDKTQPCGEGMQKAGCSVL